MKGVIREINGYDLQLWEYAQSLMAYRLKLVAPAISAVKRRLGIDLHQKFVDPGAARNAALLARCRGLQSSPSRQVQKRAIGIFQPPGHKGPF